MICGRVIASPVGAPNWWAAVLSHTKQFHDIALVSATERLIAEKKKKLRMIDKSEFDDDSD